MKLQFFYKFFIIIFIIITIFNIFNYKTIEGFGTSSSLPNIISNDNFDQYFMVDTGIANCSNQSGCPTNVSEYITSPGIIEWKNGKSITFRTKNAVLPSGEGFIGFKLNSVPMNKNIWNSIWLMGKNMGHSTCGPCLEIDIYELMNQWWNGVPKISFHDWPSGLGAQPKSDQGCFGIYLNGGIGDGTCNSKYGNIIKNWNWNSVQSKIYNGASWYTLATKDSYGPLIYVGISLNGWLPKSNQELSLDNIKNNSDFLVSSGSGNIKGNPVGGFYFCLTSTTSSNDNFTSTKWNIPEIVNYDGLPSSNQIPEPKVIPESKITPKPKVIPEPKVTPETNITPKPKVTPKPIPHLPSDNISNKNKYCNLKPADIGGCECANPNDPNDKLPCTLQSDGSCKISGNDSWGICDPKCCK